MTEILIPLPSSDFDPTECAVPWRRWVSEGLRVRFATPDGKPASADPRMLTGEGLGLFAPLLRAHQHGREAYKRLEADARFNAPIAYKEMRVADFHGLLLPGGHAPGMKSYLESPLLMRFVAAFMAAGKPMAAVCHGVLLAARSRNPEGQSALYGRRTTGLPEWMEMSAWKLTRQQLGNYYRTYPTPLQQEVQSYLASAKDFVAGPRWSLRGYLRDDPIRTYLGFTVRDDHYLSARWPGDAHRLADEFLAMLRS